MIILVLVNALAFMVIPPVTAGSTSKTYTSHIDDAHLYVSDSSYAIAHNSSSGSIWDSGSGDCGQYVTGGLYSVMRLALFFDTTSIPAGANITSVVLSLNVASDDSTTDFNLTVQTSLGYPHQPVVAGDYNYLHYWGNGGYLNTSSLGAGYNNITFTSAGRGWINAGSTTALMVRSSRDIAGTTPTGAESVSFYMANYGSKQPLLYVSYSYGDNFYLLYGAYDETGTRSGAVNITMYRTTESAVTFTLDGSYNATSAALDSMFVVDCGNNYTRRYGVMDSFESIYIFLPSQPFSVYYVTLVDYVGITNAYLESLLNVNGTDHVIERIPVSETNMMEFLLSWGVTYRFRLVADQGTYTFKAVTAGADTTLIYTVSSITFPADARHMGNITVACSRLSTYVISLNYTDAANLTTWIYVSMTEWDETTADYTTNSTGSIHTISWDQAVTSKGYSVSCRAAHGEEGTLTWNFIVGPYETFTNVWDVSFLGTFPVAVNQLVGIVLVLVVFAGFSYASTIAGILSTLLMTAWMVYLGWLDIGWGWLTFVGCIAVLAIFAFAKSRREPA